VQLSYVMSSLCRSVQLYPHRYGPLADAVT
jgi:hypothetical protein